MDDKTPDTPPNKGGRPKGTTKPKPPAPRSKALALAAAKGGDAMSTVIANHNQTPAPHNRNVTDDDMVMVLSRVAAGETMKAVCTQLGISAALVRQRAYDRPDEWGKSLLMARAMGADQQFEEMIEVARDMTLDTARAKLIADTLEKMAMAGNRLVYGKHVQVDQRQAVIIKLDSDDRDLT